LLTCWVPICLLRSVSTLQCRFSRVQEGRGNVITRSIIRRVNF
jgi:hypothetical protein